MDSSRSLGRRSRKWEVSRRVARLSVLAIGLAFSPSLSGCTAEDWSIDRLVSAMAGDAFSLSADDRRQLARFDSAFAQSANGGARDERRQHFVGAFARVRAEYVRDVPASRLIDAALEGAEAISRRRAVPDAQREQIPATVDPKIEATVIAADRQADHGGPLTLDERARLARYLAEEQLPSTTPFPGNPSHRPFACGDATLEAAEAVAGPRRVAETIAAMGSRHSYTASARDDSERTYAMKKGLEPERMRDIVIQIVETAWRQVDRMDLPTANYELARLDRSHRHQGGRSTTPRLIVPSIEQPAKPRASTRADATAPTDEKPNRGWRGGR